jgi:phosphatidylserine decarboxylase
LKARRELLVASEGIPLLFLVTVATAAVGWLVGFEYAVVPFLALVGLLFVFRDPIRVIPAIPLGVVSPVDGRVVEVTTGRDGPIEGEAHCIRIRASVFGAYTARSPVEGKVMELHRLDHARVVHAGGLWVRTDEGVDVAMQFGGNRFGLVPRAFLQYGERVGQGERCAWLRLTRVAEVWLPAEGRVLVQQGERVTAGSSVLARLPHSQAA